MERARRALAAGCAVVTDTNMAAAGINKTSAARFGVEVVCRMAEKEVREAALARGVTRAVVSMEIAAEKTPEAIFAIGNAPTALIRLCELVKEGRAKPRSSSACRSASSTSSSRRSCSCAPMFRISRRWDARAARRSPLR